MNRTHLQLAGTLLFTAACGGGAGDPITEVSSLVGEVCAEAPDVGSQTEYECTQIIGFSQTSNWYGNNGAHFEGAAGIDPDRWQLLWHPGAGVENWADPDYDGYDPAATYPVLLALPPGAQDQAMVEAGFARYWGAPARAAGWVVVSPVAPEGRAFWQGGEAAIPPLLNRWRLNRPSSNRRLAMKILPSTSCLL